MVSLKSYSPPNFTLKPENDDFQQESPLPGGKPPFSGSMIVFWGVYLGGGFKYFLCSPLFGADFQFD